MFIKTQNRKCNKNNLVYFLFRLDVAAFLVYIALDPLEPEL